jgi:hypothetical protein
MPHTARSASSWAPAGRQVQARVDRDRPAASAQRSASPTACQHRRVRVRRAQPAAGAHVHHRQVAAGDACPPSAHPGAERLPDHLAPPTGSLPRGVSGAFRDGSGLRPGSCAISAGCASCPGPGHRLAVAAACRRDDDKRRLLEPAAAAERRRAHVAAGPAWIRCATPATSRPRRRDRARRPGRADPLAAAGADDGVSPARAATSIATPPPSCAVKF